MRPAPHLPEALSGLHPATSHPCTRCGTPTAALANGRGRLDICAKCGTFEMTTHDGLEQLFSLRDMSLPTLKRGR
ncbi:MAG TPA: hypothetical protein VM370_12205 [Candidatus Thermoplasmatota archaeon]|nr:hypothetical protein [Candidatus Thermoplasmatota archaeon]